jgi:hypothetical protein
MENSTTGRTPARPPRAASGPSRPSSNLPSAPAKETDRRRLDITETWQAEALDPRTLAAILQAAIEERIDRELYEAVLEEEREARQGVLSPLRDV